MRTMGVMASSFEADSFDSAVASWLRIRLRRAMLSGLVGLPLFILGLWLLDTRGSLNQTEIHNVWDVVGGLATGIGLCMAWIGGFMMWTALRWQRMIRRSSWVSSPVGTVPSWLLVPDGRILVVLPEFYPGGVYSVGVSTAFSRHGIVAAADVLVAGRPGSTVVVAVPPFALLTVRPPRTAWTRRRWLWRIAHPTETNLSPLRRLFEARKRS